MDGGQQETLMVPGPWRVSEWLPHPTCRPRCGPGWGTHIPWGMGVWGGCSEGCCPPMGARARRNWPAPPPAPSSAHPRCQDPQATRKVHGSAPRPMLMYSGYPPRVHWGLLEKPDLKRAPKKGASPGEWADWHKGSPRAHRSKSCSLRVLQFFLPWKQ